jgi:hypothetical protein
LLRFSPSRRNPAGDWLRLKSPLRLTNVKPAARTGLLTGRRSAILDGMKRDVRWLGATVLLAFTGAAAMQGVARADELKLKDGSRIVGTIVGFEENSFKVKTGYGYAVVQKDQVTTITMSDAPARPEAEKKPEPAAEKSAPPAKPAKTETAAAPAPTPAPVAPKPAAPAEPTVSSAAAAPPPSKWPKPEAASTVPAAAPAVAPAAPAAIAAKTAPSSAVAAPTPANSTAATTASPAPTPAAPVSPANAPKAAATTTAAKSPVPSPAPAAVPAKPAGPPPVREEVTGNLYVNETYGFRMFKPPGWDLIAGARAIMPGALAALGTSDERTYLMIGLAPAGESLGDGIDQAEQRLREAMASFRLTEQKRMMVSGVSSIAHRFRGTVDAHDWSGVVVFVPLGAKVYTIFGMTYADSDLVQIQENVINRAITSLQFTKN